MPDVLTPAIVLRHVNYRESDRMLTLFSPEHGRIDALARGCRKQKSKLQAATELFATGEYRFFRNRDHHTLTGCILAETYYPLREDYDTLVYGAYMLNVCEAAVQPNEALPDLYALLLTGLAHLTYTQPPRPPRAVAAVFLLLLAGCLGYRPALDVCPVCGAAIDFTRTPRFDALSGGAVCAACGAAAQDMAPATLAFLRHAQACGLDALANCPPAAIQSEALALMRRYIEGRLERIVKAAKLLPP
ncbi:MAG: DNA repair protein RecO [Oscillospiraceae bacterium]|jgi:DNA repair protein RecO (recombination protein O)|nr:DNA repair protein RecO [Oscillospiraceae bacterium]